MEIIKYKDFEGSVETDIERYCCRGKILFIDDLVTYESVTLQGLQKQFEEAVDDYIETCAQIGKEPQKPFRGLFNVRVKPELHRAAVRKAAADETSLNELVGKALEAFIENANESSATLALDIPKSIDLKLTTSTTTNIVNNDSNVIFGSSLKSKNSVSASSGNIVYLPVASNSKGNENVYKKNY